MYIVCHYGEIALKGKNRDFFEKKLADNIKKQLNRASGVFYNSVRILPGRIIVSLPQKNSVKKLENIFKNIFGIINYSFAEKSTSEIEKLKEASWQYVQNKKFKTFRISAARSDKNYPLTSQQINEKIGAYLVKKSGASVKLKNQTLNLFIEILGRDAYLYAKKISGAGGMPAGSAGQALALLSGGFDSPVAAYYAMKRGVKLDFLHFHSLPYTSRASLEKVEKIAQELNKFQLNCKIYLVPFSGFQKEIMIKAPEKFRVVLYRRIMVKIAEKLAQKFDYKILVSGDSIAQVSSQTLENLNVVSRAVEIPILRPLSGFDKTEIMEVAGKIGTYEISILPHDDCCSRLMPKNPATRARLLDVLNAEKALDVQKMIKLSLQEIEEKWLS